MVDHRQLQAADKSKIIEGVQERAALLRARVRRYQELSEKAREFGVQVDQDRTRERELTARVQTLLEGVALGEAPQKDLEAARRELRDARDRLEGADVVGPRLDREAAKLWDVEGEPVVSASVDYLRDAGEWFRAEVAAHAEQLRGEILAPILELEGFIPSGESLSIVLRREAGLFDNLLGAIAGVGHGDARPMMRQQLPGGGWVPYDDPRAVQERGRIRKQVEAELAEARYSGRVATFARSVVSALGAGS